MSGPLTMGRLATGPKNLAAVEVDTEVYNLASPPARKGGDPVIIDPGKAIDGAPTVSADGTLAMAGWRSGEAGVWIKPPGGEVRVYAGKEKGINQPPGSEWPITFLDISAAIGAEFELEVPAAARGFVHIVAGAARLGAGATPAAAGDVAWFEPSDGAGGDRLAIKADRPLRAAGLMRRPRPRRYVVDVRRLPRAPGGAGLLDPGERRVPVQRPEVGDQEGQPRPLLELRAGVGDLGVQTGWIGGEPGEPGRGEGQLIREAVGVGA